MNITDLKKEFLVFREQCIWTRTCFNIYSDLYESDQATLDILSKKAPIFFQDINWILIEYCLIQIGKHLDPIQTMRRTNLTIEYIDSELDNAHLMNSEIKHLSNELMNYRTLIKDARNKILSHTDRDAVLSDHHLGAHSKE